MLHNQFGLVSEASGLALADLLPVAAAISKQLARDFAPLWARTVTIGAFASRAQIPAGAWPIIVTDHMDEPGALGYHSDANHQPYSLVEHTPDWTITASHEALEMAGDPYGNRLHAGNLRGQRVLFLMELCDPPEDFSYTVDGVAVSDFLTPHWYDPDGKRDGPFSFLGNLVAPRSIAKGGYMSYVNPRTGVWYQDTWFGGAAPATVTLGRTDQMPGATLREKVDKLSAQSKNKSKS